jgi:hypothetical protein
MVQYVNATGFPPDPRRLQFAEIGPTRWRWAVYVGVGLYMPTFGLERRLRALHVGVGSCTLVKSCIHGCWAVHAGVWLEMEVLGPTRWRWV